MAPIRVGILGLTATPTGWAPRAHLPYLLKSPHYTIHGLCNSTPETTKAAIKSHNLPPSTRVYDSAAALAADPDIDLVVVCTRVDTHYALTKSALLAGKNAFVEWPLGANGTQAEELTSLARQKGVKTVIGLQARMNPSVKKIREVIESGRIGKLLSVSVQAAEQRLTAAVAEKMAYFADRKIGGNMLTIQAMHILDSIFSVHGELAEWTPLLGNQIPYIDIMHSQNGGRVERREKDTPDQVIISGRFGKEGVSTGAIFSFHMRGGQPFKGQPGLVWRIYGEKGEVSVTCGVSAIQLGLPLTIAVFDHASDTVEEVLKGDEFDAGFWEDLPVVARIVGRLYEAYALGQEYGDWELAVKRHRFVEKVFAEGGL